VHVLLGSLVNKDVPWRLTPPDVHIQIRARKHLSWRQLLIKLTIIARHRKVIVGSVVELMRTLNLSEIHKFLKLIFLGGEVGVLVGALEVGVFDLAEVIAFVEVQVLTAEALAFPTVNFLLLLLSALWVFDE